MATLTNATYTAPQVTKTLIISKAPAFINMENLSTTWTGSPIPMPASTTPGNLSVLTVKYNGSTTPPTAPGTYTVVATLTNATYTATQVSKTLTITPVQATIVMNDVTTPWTGSPIPMPVSTNPGNLSVLTVKYNGSTTAPTAPGS